MLGMVTATQGQYQTVHQTVLNIAFLEINLATIDATTVGRQEELHPKALERLYF